MRKEVLIPKKKEKRALPVEQTASVLFALPPKAPPRRTGKLRPATGQVSGPGGTPE